MKNETNIAKKEEAGALAVNMFEADANAGSQNIGQDDVALPFLKVLGQLSPEINKKHAKYVEGAEPGMILNSVTKELFDGDKGIEVIPVFYNRKYLEWQDRGEGVGAPVNIFSIDVTFALDVVNATAVAVDPDAPAGDVLNPTIGVPVNPEPSLFKNISRTAPVPTTGFASAVIPIPTN